MLALAAALIGASSTFEAGTALEVMISASAVDKMLVPMTHQLKDLLDVLEPHLNRAGFLIEVLGWKDWWVMNVGEAQDQVAMRASDDACPSSDAIHRVVACFRELSRIGDVSRLSSLLDLTHLGLVLSSNGALDFPRTSATRKGELYLMNPAPRLPSCTQMKNFPSRSRSKPVEITKSSQKSYTTQPSILKDQSMISIWYVRAFCIC